MITPRGAIAKAVIRRRRHGLNEKSAACLGSMANKLTCTCTEIQEGKKVTQCSPSSIPWPNATEEPAGLRAERTGRISRHVRKLNGVQAIYCLALVPCCDIEPLRILLATHVVAIGSSNAIGRPLVELAKSYIESRGSSRQPASRNRGRAVPPTFTPAAPS